MRSVLLIFAAIVVAGGGFFAYLWWQADVKGSVGVVSAITAASRPADSADPNQMLGETHSAWIKVPDEQTGEIAQEFRAERHEPIKGTNRVRVFNPEARFYMGRT